jgi:hypothetical protein
VLPPDLDDASLAALAALDPVEREEAAAALARRADTSADAAVAAALAAADGDGAATVHSTATQRPHAGRWTYDELRRVAVFEAVLVSHDY